MTWEKLVEREGDFLRNHLLYESLPSFANEFGLPFADLLTVREGRTFTHYLDSEGVRQLNRFTAGLGSSELTAIHDKGIRYYEALISCAESLRDRQLSWCTDGELADFAKVYFAAYKKPYPYHLLSVLGEHLSEENAQTLGKIRLFGRSSFNQVHVLAEGFFAEMAVRLDIPKEHLQFLTPMEIVHGLEGYRPRLQRRQTCYLLHKEGRFHLVEDETFMVPVRESAAVEGRGTFSAKVTGPVRIVCTKTDMRSVQRGDIVVTRMVTPDMMSHEIKRAAAIVTDEGGATCHAAIISREIAVPALLGTKNATTLLKDGEIVTVDTKKGTVTCS